MRRAILPWACGMAALTALFIVGTALAKPQAVRSQPQPEATLQERPTQVEIWFSEPLTARQDVNVIVVRDAYNQRIDNGDTAFDADDPTHLRVTLREDVPPGPYSVRWRVIAAADGTISEGGYSFRVGSVITATPTGPTQEATPAIRQAPARPGDSPDRTTVIVGTLLGAGGAILLGLIGFFIRWALGLTKMPPQQPTATGH